MYSANTFACMLRNSSMLDCMGLFLASADDSITEATVALQALHLDCVCLKLLA